MVQPLKELVRKALVQANDSKVVQRTFGAIKGLHGAVQKKFFEGEAPAMYRLKGNKYSHHYGAPKRAQGVNAAPYLAGAVIAGMGVFFIVLPISFNRSYDASKQRYEAFAKENQDMLERQFDRGQFSRAKS
eukprot:symbB.v1.2.018594.t1/scaffold1489.1/size143467/2